LLIGDPEILQIPDAAWDADKAAIPSIRKQDRAGLARAFDLPCCGLEQVSVLARDLGTAQVALLGRLSRPDKPAKCR
jgi:hypothetical protein